MTFICPTVGVPWWMLVLNLVFDLLIAVAYYRIPIQLYRAVKRNRPTLGPLYLLFAGFILLCGTTHVAKQVALLIPNTFAYEVLIGGMTAVLSWFTSAAIGRLNPKVQDHLDKVQADIARIAELEAEVAQLRGLKA